MAPPKPREPPPKSPCCLPPRNATISAPRIPEGPSPITDAPGNAKPLDNNCRSSSGSHAIAAFDVDGRRFLAATENLSLKPFMNSSSLTFGSSLNLFSRNELTTSSQARSGGLAIPQSNECGHRTRERYSFLQMGIEIRTFWSSSVGADLRNLNKRGRLEAWPSPSRRDGGDFAVEFALAGWRNYAQLR